MTEDAARYDVTSEEYRLEDRRIREVERVQARASELAVENVRLRQAGRRLAALLEVSGGPGARARRAAVSAWSQEDSDDAPF